jgi:hypothetical protein
LFFLLQVVVVSFCCCCDVDGDVAGLSFVTIVAFGQSRACVVMVRQTKNKPNSNNPP